MIERKTNNEFLKQIKVIYKDNYDYSFIEYKNCRTKVEVFCIKHKLKFLQTPSQLLKNVKGCPKCRGEIAKNALSSTTEEWIEKAVKVHNGDYDYSLVNYTGAGNSVKIKCLVHGIFNQKANDHLAGHKCSKCAYISKVNYNLVEISKEENKNKIVDFYIIRVYSEETGEEFIKVGISKNLKERYQGYPFTGKYKIEKLFILKTTLDQAYYLERTILRDLRKEFLYIPNIKFPGYTECLNIILKETILDNLNLILKEHE
jgi:hypothetical protein